MQENFEYVLIAILAVNTAALIAQTLVMHKLWGAAAMCVKAAVSLEAAASAFMTTLKTALSSSQGEAEDVA